MSEQCNHECGSCAQNCGDRTSENQFLAKLNKDSKVKKVIGVVSGKGGVGKSMVTSLLACAMNRENYKTAILDADITGPSIPKAFGLKGIADVEGEALLPVETANKIKVMSLNLLVEEDTEPVIWRGPVIGATVKQFWTDVKWGEVDYMFVDMPPGTGDVPLTIYQSLPLDGIVIVTSPQELVTMIVEKALKMAKNMNVPVLGIVENMSYFECPNCNEKHAIFGESHIEEVAARYGIDTTVRMPIDPKLANACDEGAMEELEYDFMQPLVERFQK